MTAQVQVIWQAGEFRVIQHENGKFYPQRLRIANNGLGWQYEPEYKSYKTAQVAKRALPQF